MQRLVAADEGRNERQLGVVDAHGNGASYTGSECNAWAGHRTGAVLRRAGEHPGRSGDRRRARRDVRGDGGQEPRGPVDRVPRRGAACGRRQPRPAVGVAPRRRARRRLCAALRRARRSPRRRPSAADRGAAPHSHDALPHVRQDAARRMAADRPGAAHGDRRAARAARPRRRSTRGQASRTSRSASTARPRSTRSCSRLCGTRHEGSEAGRDRRHPRVRDARVEAGAQDARRDGVRHQRVHGRERGRRDRRGAHRAAARARGDLRRHDGSCDLHGRRRDGRRACRDARLPRRRGPGTACDRERARHHGARDRRRAREARDLGVGVLLSRARADARRRLRHGTAAPRGGARREGRAGVALPARLRRGARRQPRTRARRARSRSRRARSDWRKSAQTDEDFASIRDDPRFPKAGSDPGSEPKAPETHRLPSQCRGWTKPTLSPGS